MERKEKKKKKEPKGYFPPENPYILGTNEVTGLPHE